MVLFRSGSILHQTKFVVLFHCKAHGMLEKYKLPMNSNEKRLLREENKLVELQNGNLKKTSQICCSNVFERFIVQNVLEKLSCSKGGGGKTDYKNFEFDYLSFYAMRILTFDLFLSLSCLFAAYSQYQFSPLKKANFNCPSIQDLFEKLMIKYI